MSIDDLIDELSDSISSSNAHDSVRRPLEAGTPGQGETHDARDVGRSEGEHGEGEISASLRDLYERGFARAKEANRLETRGEISAAREAYVLAAEDFMRVVHDETAEDKRALAAGAVRARRGDWLGAARSARIVIAARQSSPLRSAVAARS